MKFLILLSLISVPAFATKKVELWCSHKKVCQLVKDVTAKTAIVKMSTNDKELKAAGIYISTPYSLDSNSKKIVTYRENQSLETIRLYLPSNIIKLYKTQMTSPLEKLSNFWLYPNILCYMERGLIKRLNKLNIATRRHKCAHYNSHQSELRKLLKKYRPLSIETTNTAISAHFRMKNVFFNDEKKQKLNINLDEYIKNWSSDELFSEFPQIVNIIEKLGSKK